MYPWGMVGAGSLLNCLGWFSLLQPLLHSHHWINLEGFMTSQEVRQVILQAWRESTEPSMESGKGLSGDPDRQHVCSHLQTLRQHSFQ